MKEQNAKPKILLTGGHLSPLLAVISVLEKNADVLVVGRRFSFEADSSESLEYKILKDKKILFYDLKAARLQRKITRHTIPALMKAPKSVMSAISILNREKPDAVLTFGGYIALPVSIAAFIKGIPVVLHEQTLGAGLANKLISKIAKKVLISHPDSFKLFPQSKTILTGNPVRPEIYMVRDKFEIPSGKDILLVMGGSTGSHRINVLVEDALNLLLARFTVVHQTGDAQEFKDFDRLSKKRDSLSYTLQKHYILKKFIDPSEIGWVYHNADIVLCRSGANTVSELIALQKRALMIPLPYAQNNEQKENAELVKSMGLGLILEEDEMNEGILMEKLDEVMKLKVKNGTREKNTAADKIVHEVLSV